MYDRSLKRDAMGAQVRVCVCLSVCVRVCLWKEMKSNTTWGDPRRVHGEFSK